jgi:hypothetical protein
MSPRSSENPTNNRPIRTLAALPGGGLAGEATFAAPPHNNIASNAATHTRRRVVGHKRRVNDVSDGGSFRRKRPWWPHSQVGWSRTVCTVRQDRRRLRLGAGAYDNLYCPLLHFVGAVVPTDIGNYSDASCLQGVSKRQHGRF